MNVSQRAITDRLPLQKFAIASSRVEMVAVMQQPSRSRGALEYWHHYTLNYDHQIFERFPPVIITGLTSYFLFISGVLYFLFYLQFLQHLHCSILCTHLVALSIIEDVPFPYEFFMVIPCSQTNEEPDIFETSG